MNGRTIISFDYAIKYMLRDKANFDILEGFLSELLRRKINVLGLLESESNKVDGADKTNRVDLKAQIDNGEIALFEIQFYDQVDFLGKVLYNACKAVVEQVSSGKLYGIRKVYSINISYNSFGAERDYQFVAKLQGFRGCHTDEVIPFEQPYDFTGSADAAPTFDIHPEYYLILPKKFDEEIKGRFDEWVYVLKTSVVKSEFTAGGLKEAAIKLDMLKMTRDERNAYERFLADKQSIDSVIYTAEQKSEAKGRAEGRAQGRVEGEAAGEVKGRLGVAKAMKTKGMDVNEIAELTGLRADEILKL